MGDKTFFSLPEKFRPLPNRKNIVLSLDPELKIEGTEVFSGFQKVIEKYKNEEIFIIGGATIYDLFLKNNLVDKIYLTEIDGEFKGDIYFPQKYLKNFSEVSRQRNKSDEKNL
jgi:dihydrofolate reductase